VDLSEKLGCVADCAEDLESCLLKNVNEAVSKDRLVLSHEYSDPGTADHPLSLLPTSRQSVGRCPDSAGPLERPMMTVLGPCSHRRTAVIATVQRCGRVLLYAMARRREGRTVRCILTLRRPMGQSSATRAAAIT